MNNRNMQSAMHRKHTRIGAGTLALTLALSIPVGSAFANEGPQVPENSNQGIVAQASSINLGSAGKVFAYGAQANVNISLMNASNTSKNSMAAGCFDGKATLAIDSNGVAKVTVKLKGANIMGATAYATGIDVYQGTSASGESVAATIDETQSVVIDGKETVVPKTASFVIPQAASGLDGVFIKLPNTGMPGNAPNAFLSIDYANASITNADGNGEAPVKTVAMHRLYNPNSGEHFYTASDAERDDLVAQGWNTEGEGWNAPETSNTPVYRMYNPVAGEHHYTVDASEKDGLVAAGWNFESVGWYSDDNKSVPLYRDYNPNQFSNNHNYTKDTTEHEWLVSIGWQEEGLAWYGVK